MAFRYAARGTALLFATIALAGCASESLKSKRVPLTRGCYYSNRDMSEPGLGRTFPSSDKFWPSESRKAGETGAPEVNVCVAPDGTLAGEPTVVTSSGSERLDHAAIAMAKAGTYCPAMDGETKVARCKKIRVRFGY
jgi:TonB family protein